MSPTAYLPLTSCNRCPHNNVTPDYTEDSWERPEKWSCTKSGNRVIARYVEWNDKTPIPDWCPLLGNGGKDVE